MRSKNTTTSETSAWFVLQYQKIFTYLTRNVIARVLQQCNMYILEALRWEMRAMSS